MDERVTRVLTEHTEAQFVVRAVVGDHHLHVVWAVRGPP
jgi:hypothetical protein